jgi:CheY-like chemotaxis protein
MARVLIVDDEPDILLMLRVNLEADGYATALAADGESALQRIAEESTAWPSSRRRRW